MRFVPVVLLLCESYLLFRARRKCDVAGAALVRGKVSFPFVFNAMFLVQELNEALFPLLLLRRYSTFNVNL